MLDTSVVESVLDDSKRNQIKEEIFKKFLDYRKTLKVMMGDAPISIFCFSKQVEKALIESGCVRVYDLFDLDLVKVKGLSDDSLRNLAARIDEFLSML
jgi:metal-dependent HD superfamily phosphatase/phosphodiesterase